jgi:hypothetical protein
LDQSLGYQHYASIDLAFMEISFTFLVHNALRFPAGATDSAGTPLSVFDLQSKYFTATRPIYTEKYGKITRVIFC